MASQSVRWMERAATDDETQDWDSQHCKRLQADLFAPCSAPPEREKNAETKNVASASTTTTTKLAGLTTSSVIRTTAASEPPFAAYRLPGVKKDAASTPRHRISQRYLPTMTLDTRSKDLDHTQRSSMSLTQENSSSAYGILNIPSFVSRPNAVGTSTAGVDGDVDGPDAHGRQSSEEIVARAPLHGIEQHSARTDVTAHTYTENDTGHIMLEYHPEPDILAAEQAESQDASYAAARMAPSSQPPLYDPETPAPPINPFQHRGSVLRGFEMFGATQPSSIGRHVASPTSSRPSPDVYNDFTSPPRRLVSSPLQRRNDEDERIPVPSSLRNILGQSTSDVSPDTTTPRELDIQPFDVERPLPRMNSIPEPRRYNSIKESQDRRKALETTPPKSDPDDSDSDIDFEPRKQRQRRQRERDIQRQLSTIELHQPVSLTQPRSSTLALVEVPSTSTRRQQSADNDHSAPGTQQDDFIADSQGHHTQSEYDTGVASPCNLRFPKNTTAGQARHHVNTSQTNPDDSRQSPPPQPDLPHKLDHESSHTRDLNTTQSPSPRDDKSSQRQLEPDLPPREFPPNGNYLKTPLAIKPQIFSDPGVATVPETSPAEDQLRPMGDIGLSFGTNGDEESLQIPPGFTQDDEFLHILNLQDSPVPPQRIRSFKKRPHDIANKQPHTTLSSNTSTQFPLPQNSSGHSLIAQPDIDPWRSRSEPTRINAEDGKTTNHSLDNKNSPTAIHYDRMELRMRAELKGPSRSLRRSSDPPAILKASGIPASGGARPYSSPNTAASSSSELSSVSSSMVGTPDTDFCVIKTCSPKTTAEPPHKISAPRQLVGKGKTVARKPPKRSMKRKSAPTLSDRNKTRMSPRASKRQSTGVGAKEHSADPLSLPSPSIAKKHMMRNTVARLFEGMAFAVSYVKQEQEKSDVIKNILDYGGTILEDGFDALFEAEAKHIAATDEDKRGLTVASEAKSFGFVALVADEHSRKSKYMQALALGFPCISGRWIMSSITKGVALNWAPYLLCAGQSSFLDNAFLSRTLASYSATEATLPTTFAARDKILEGKSVLLVMTKSKINEKRRAFMFLTRALGPCRLGQVADYPEARKRLLEAESNGLGWDLLYVDTNPDAAKSAIFTSAPPPTGGSGKRKRLSTGVSGSTMPTPKRVRTLTDEDIIQSLILGQLVEE